jgi:hypothetical protein
VYLIPVGMDVLRSPTGDTLATREYRIFDQALPVPFPIGNSELGNSAWIPVNDTLSGQYGEIRRFASMRAFRDGSVPGRGGSRDCGQHAAGRALHLEHAMAAHHPGGTLLFDQNRGLDTFINSVSDIRLLIMTYSYAGN